VNLSFDKIPLNFQILTQRRQARKEKIKFSVFAPGETIFLK
jgi:hypothetical protein